MRRAASATRGWSLHRGPIVAFAISGAAGGQGYLQRLAVLPEHQRHGHGRALTVDSLAWMRRRRLGHAVVNTGIDNEAARSLYESLGFRLLSDRLVVMQLDLSPGR
jgi:ribosomal protein S18 acetylase RimI-like enzyme